MRSYATYGFFGVMSSKLALQLDTVSLGAYVSKEEVGIYGILLFAITFMSMPFDTLKRIGKPILMDAITKDDKPAVRQLYQRSSLILSFIGLYFFTLVVASYHDFFSLIGQLDKFGPFLLVFVMLGVATLVDLLGSFNGELIIFNKYYRAQLPMLMVLAVSNLVLNWYFITRLKLGLHGAALATAISLASFNLIKSVFVYAKFRLSPLKKESVYPLLLSTLFCLLLFNFSPTTIDWLNLLLKSGLISLAFFAYFWWTPFLPELKENLQKLLKQYLRI